MRQKSIASESEKHEGIASATARNMADALTYLIGVAARAGLVRIATKLRTVRDDLAVTINGTGQTKDVRQPKRPIRSAPRSH